MVEEFNNKIMKDAVTLLCANMGWDSGHSNAIDILADVMKRYLGHLAKSTHRYAEHYGRTDVNLDDAGLALKDLGVNPQELEEYIQNYDPLPLPYVHKVPLYPIPRTSKLNFLRPGSEEVLTRPVHVHEYMPPMIFEPKIVNHEELKEPQEEEEEEEPEPVVEKMEEEEEEKMEIEQIPEQPNHTPPPPPPPSSSSKRKENAESSEDEIETLESKSPGAPFVPFSSLTTVTKTKRGGENPAIKRVRMMLEEDGHPVREVSSVMMTTSGFLSSSREGRLPDSRPPANREFFDISPPPPVDRKKKSLTMKRIVVGIKKIDKEKDTDEKEEEPELFAKPDKIVQAPIPQLPLQDRTLKKKHKKKLKLDKEMLKKLAKGLEQRDRNKLKIFKSQTKLLLDKSKKRKHNQVPLGQTPSQLDNIDSDEDFGMDQQQQLPLFSVPAHLKMRKQFPQANRTFLQARAGISSLSPEGKKKRGRPRKNVSPSVVGMPMPGQGVPLSAAALANLGRGLMDDRPLKIKKSHMEPDMRSLIPEVQLNVPPQVVHKAPKPPRMQAHPSGFDMLLPNTPGLIPSASNFILPPPPPLIKMPTQSPTTPHIPPAIQITPSAPSPIKESKMPFANVCSSVTITPIDMPGQKLPTRYDKTVTPGIGSPLMRQQPKIENIPAASLPPVISTEPSSGITITPIVMDQGGYNNEDSMDIDEQEGDGDIEMGVKRGVSMLAKLEEDMKSKEQRRKEKERRKELKKEKKKEKKDKKRDKGEKSEKKKMKKEGLLGIPASIPKLTLKLSSGTPTPVQSPNPPQVLIGESSPPLKKITIKAIEEASTRTPSPDLARFSPLVTRTPVLKPGRAAKAHAAAAVAADAMGASQQMIIFPPRSRNKSDTSKQAARGRSIKSSAPPSSKKQGAQGGLITETVGCIVDEQGNKTWICPTCGRPDDGSPMIGCDRCDDWYHFPCVGIMKPPEDDTEWFCPRCRKKKKK